MWIDYERIPMNTQSDSPVTQRRVSWHKRLFARMIASESESARHYYESRKRTLLGDLHGTVLEIGAGAGANLEYYPRDVQWIGIEPNPAMFPYLQQEAQRLGMTVQLREGVAEQLAVDDNSVDAVVTTFVLCSVHDPRQALQEIKRVLKPGGRFVFMEHVAAPPDSRTRSVQRLLKPLWKPLADGCNPDRETGSTIEAAGFSSVQIEHFKIAVPVVGPHIAGVAVK
jgi:SAM-dependent methyltransferase